MTKQELQSLLAQYGATPIHDRGQHFLLDEHVVEKIVQAAHITVQDIVLEVGPGPGILTEKLIATRAQITAVELDRKMCQLLRDRFAQHKNFSLVQADVMEFDHASLGSGFKLVANLPYNISSVVLQKFLLPKIGFPTPHSLTLMLQREVVDRILATPSRMSSLAIFVQTLGKPHLVTRVPSGAFFPPPKVESSVIHITTFSKEHLADFFQNTTPEHYFSLVSQGFSAPRRQLHNTIADKFGGGDAAKKALINAKISPSARPQELSVIDWRNLAIQQ